jgi:hypothetical protein
MLDKEARDKLFPGRVTVFPVDPVETPKPSSILPEYRTDVFIAMNGWLLAPVGRDGKWSRDGIEDTIQYVFVYGFEFIVSPHPPIKELLEWRDLDLNIIHPHESHLDLQYKGGRLTRLEFSDNDSVSFEYLGKIRT